MANIYDPEWQREFDEGGFALRGSSVGAAAGTKEVGMTVYEVPPGKRNMPYHAHHGIEETIVVLAGTPTIRTPEGKTTLAPGDVHCFGKGSASAHQVINDSDEPVRFLMLSSSADADFAEYPDGGKLAVFSGEWGSDTAFRKIVASSEERGYFEGES